MMTDALFEKRFFNCELPPDQFDHTAHLRLAWLQLSKNELEGAIAKVATTIKNYTIHHEAQNKYHHTLTIASVKVVYHFRLKSKQDSFKGFLEEFPRLQSSFKELIDSHYGFDIFASAEAKTTYLEPDLLPFDG
ncbi:MAG: hypothetical protein AAGD88_10085 [Bacteroidota bacterium]